MQASTSKSISLGLKMDSQEATNRHKLKKHIVAIPYPGRGHINPMMNFCKLIISRRPHFLISFIITEEWEGLIGSDPKPVNIEYVTIPNVIPSEIGRGKDSAGFYEACSTKLEAPVEQLLDQLKLPKPSVIVFDTSMSWVVRVGNRRNIPVASFFTQSALMFSIYYHYSLLVLNGHADVDISSIHMLSISLLYCGLK